MKRILVLGVFFFTLLSAVINAQDTSINSFELTVDNYDWMEWQESHIKWLRDSQFISNMGCSQFAFACYSGELQKVKQFIESGCDVNERNYSAPFRWVSSFYEVDRDSDLYTPVMYAVEGGQLSILRYLIDEGADVNMPDSNGYTPLIKAVIEGYSATALLIIENGADLNHKTGSGDTAIACSARFRSREIYELLKKYGAVVDILTAIKFGDMEVIESLLIANPELKAYKDKDGWTPLITAAIHNQTEVVKILIELRVNVNTTNNFGASALMHASLRGHVEIVDLLIEAGADVLIVDTHGESAMTWAIRSGEGLILDRIKEVLSDSETKRPLDNSQSD